MFFLSERASQHGVFPLVYFTFLFLPEFFFHLDPVSAGEHLYEITACQILMTLLMHGRSQELYLRGYL